MSRREDIDTAIWEDEDFDALSDDGALLYIWSFTNSRCGPSGVYRIKRRSFLEGRLSEARCKTALEELTAARFLVYEDGWLWVRSRVKHLRTRGEKMAKGIVNDFNRIPSDHPIRAHFLTEYLENSWVSRWLKQANLEDPSIPLGNPTDGFQGQGPGQGKGPGVQKKEKRRGKENPPASANGGVSKAQLRADWEEWLPHFIEVTGRTATRDGSKEAKKLFAGRRNEGRSLEELKLATIGCHADEHLRKEGFDRPETILRESNIARYIEFGRERGGAKGDDESPYDDRMEVVEV